MDDMADDVARRMSRLNSEFYRLQASSFSATRHNRWPGWDRCLSHLVGDRAAPWDAGGASLRVLDLAAGNLRFATFLARALPRRRIDYHAVDNCEDLMATAPDAVPSGRVAVATHKVDVVEALLDGDLPTRLATAGLGPELGRGFDLVVSFGFLHHVPGEAARQRLLQGLVAATHPGGLCCVSLWRFMSEPGLAERARATTAQALDALGLDAQDLGPGDYLLGWQRLPGAWRYCHSFGDAEVERLAGAVGDSARLLGNFSSDGRTSSLNRYLVFRRS
ncbi:Methyltransferase domain-containing protein [Olsenella sp. KH1P3]|uniref:Methyltransferase domain-containing protein n=2 Tax=Coriobacteriales TaxID=84999 RepID=A0A1H6I8R1_9ACTN|nr:Methyltransferase domain-containing protein [Parafannyhessea umbonata]SJZ57887.1 Methyltransferase domain-containing protein [Olsenella sp. KH1P3]